MLDKEENQSRFCDLIDNYYENNKYPNLKIVHLENEDYTYS